MASVGWDDAGAGLMGGLSGAAGLGALAGTAGALAPFLGPAGFIIGGIAGLLGSKAKKEQQNKQIDAHNKKIDKQRTLVKSQQKKVGAKTRGVATYFDALEEYQTDIIDKETNTALDTFVEGTVGQIENLEDVGAKTGLESSSIEKKISTIKDLTAGKSEDIKSLGRQKEEALSLQIAGQRAQTESSMRNMWADLAQQYDLLGEEYMDRV